MRYLLLILILASCAPRVVTKEVFVPVATPCFDKALIPPVRDLTYKQLKQTDTIFDKTKAITIDLIGLESDDKIIRAAISSCQ
jgi:hypothetical protein